MCAKLIILMMKHIPAYLKFGRSKASQIVRGVLSFQQTCETVVFGSSYQGVGVDVSLLHSTNDKQVWGVLCQQSQQALTRSLSVPTLSIK